MKPKLIMHTKLTGEVVLTISTHNSKLGEIPLGTDPKAARQKAQTFVEAVRGADDIIDQIT